MFAVKGWSVDAAALKPQTELFKSSKSQDGEEKKSSKKRKRDQLKESQHAEGAELSKKQRKKEERKRRKLEDASEAKVTANGESERSHKSHHHPKIERWEDIVLGTRKEKLGIAKQSKKQKRKEEREKEIPKDIESSEASDIEDEGAPSQTNHALSETATVQEPTKLTPMQSAMRQKLISARFRHLNQTLYTEPSTKAMELFDQSPEMFEDYHAGFRQQVSVWPENPLDKFIVAIRRRGKTKPPVQFKPYRRKANSKLIHPPKDDGVALPRSNGTSVIADLGCGDARLAHTLAVSGDVEVLNLKLHSFDLHSPSKYVTKADISNLPLKDDSVDVAILCLALMGTNWISFVEEAHRILHWKGELWVAEIKSRFGRVSKTGKPVNHSVGKRLNTMPTKASEAKAKEQAEDDEREVLQVEVDGVSAVQEQTDVSAFVQVLRRRGFILKPPSDKAVDSNNKMFVKMEFVKALTPIKGKGKPKAESRPKPEQKVKFFAEGEEDVDTDDETKVLKPCLYKIR